ncbi:DNA cytosine methyltransferase [Sphingomonas psychrotolerans]|uniref:DNA (cytosine-5-)-methyltransferase n=1 Tax=Sphingomonas psychrotolerans TaxID=1327635 RepID=A0A2K8MF81_9SPHN|nr:DNA cytosine methyltransferase [Sphingomonas psychrotolerans]ATY32535.1 DNA (cytosine-5-)-methyltransferase [Sphingomonas psychrotolerans]
MKAIELFAGAGGLGIGVSRAGFKPTSVVEWDHWCCDTIRENRKRDASAIAHWPEPIEGDVSHVDFTSHEGKVQIVTGGPPCQPFSLGGKHRAHQDSRDMWPQAVRAVREVKPQAFIFENVKGLTRETFSTYFSYIFLQLTYPEIERGKTESWVEHRARLESHHSSGSNSGLSYRVIPPRVLNAANFGVPQKRERVFFVGFRSDLGVEWSFPQETHSREALLCAKHSGVYWERHQIAKRQRPDLGDFRGGSAEALARKPWLTVRDALEGLPDPEFSPTAAARFLNHKFQPGARSYPGHTGSPIDEPAKALKAGVHGVPGGENMLVRTDGSLRYFSVRESARLQTFPDNFAFHGSWSETMRQLGNAVPVTLAEVVAKSVAAHLKASGRKPGRA